MKPEHGKPTHISNAVHHQECQSIIKKMLVLNFQMLVIKSCIGRASATQKNHHNIYHVMMTMVSCTEVRYDLQGGRENLPS